jgi:hypothetical protein
VMLASSLYTGITIERSTEPTSRYFTIRVYQAEDLKRRSALLIIQKVTLRIYE